MSLKRYKKIQAKLIYQNSCLESFIKNSLKIQLRNYMFK